jgi:N-acetylglucosamine kinase-like BadF-type ATPase
MAEDGRGPATVLTDSLFAAAQLPSSARDARSLAIWLSKAGRGAAAALAKCVLLQATAGDAIAISLRESAVKHLIALARAVLKLGSAALSCDTTATDILNVVPAPVVLAAGGGLFHDQSFWTLFSSSWDAEEEVEVQKNPTRMKCLSWCRVVNPVDGALIAAEVCLN